MVQVWNWEVKGHVPCTGAFGFTSPRSCFRARTARSKKKRHWRTLHKYEAKVSWALKFLIAILGKANNEVGPHWKERSWAGLYYRDLKHSDALFYMWQVGLYHTWQTGSKQFSARLAKYFPFESNKIQPNQIISTFWYRKLRKFWWYFLLNLRHTFTKHFLMLPFHRTKFTITKESSTVFLLCSLQKDTPCLMRSFLCFLWCCSSAIYLRTFCSCQESLLSFARTPCNAYVNESADCPTERKP